ncbi:Na+/H+ antiporter NhaA [Rathayibacter sp. KR2-224]|uniref:Na+/H+ antiporter NhaA n=1 Tax=Rathayibacter sp. KR2-224 TaxID=3400913 RepID=UPI003BFEFF86
MSLIRSERASAAILLGAAVLGLVLANTAFGPVLQDVKAARFGAASLHLDLSTGAWISDGLLAVFFFIVAIELRHELTVGELSSWQKALHPAVAAIFGVIVPAVVYLAFTLGRGLESGWPVPTATDIAFALGVLAVFGRGLPRRLRVFLLALAVLDDLIAILIIAVFFTSDPNLVDLALAVLCVAAFGLLSRMLRGRLRAPIGVLMALVGILTWMLVHASGVHATIAGVALGLVMSRDPARRTAHALEPWSNGLVLPVFAFSAALVAIPAVPISELSPAFWGIVVALPVGKFIGITFGGWLGGKVGQRSKRQSTGFVDSLVVAALGGIGFTVSLLMNELAFAGSHEVRDEGVLAVLLGSSVSIVAGGIAVALLAKRYRRLHPHPGRPAA